MTLRLTKKKLENWTREELIQTLLLRNDDAKDYSKIIIKNKKEELEFLKDLLQHESYVIDELIEKRIKELEGT